MTEPIEQKAKFLAESGNVTRNGNAFTVLQPTAHGSDGLVFTVKRDEAGAVTCDCNINKETGARCEHILAVKYFLVGEADRETKNVLDFSATLQELRRNVDPKLIKQREGWRDRNGNVQTVDYVEWHTVADILDDVAPHWTHSVKDIKEIGDIMTVTVAITIDGISREGIGTGNAHNEMGIKKAEHDALKRAAVKFGIARDLYKKESEVIERGGAFNHDNDGGFPDQPKATNVGALLTAKQLGMIRALARELRIDADEECNSVMNCRTDELSKNAASSFIKHLQVMQRGGDVMRKPLRQV
jgi:hypothetical protein